MSCVEAPLAVSVGDPAGVGPEVSVRAAVGIRAHHGVVLCGDAARLRALGAKCGFDEGRWVQLSADGPWQVPAGALGVVDVGHVENATIAARAPTADGGRHQLGALEVAMKAARQGRARALVTGPMSKAAATLAGASFTGHTEHLARACGLPVDAVSMLFLGPRLRVALVTTHLAVREVPDAITRARVMRTVRHLGEALLREAAGAPEQQRIAVAGLNPHAGEGGLLGDEELHVIAPALEQARSQPPFGSGGPALIGPLPAETAFRQAAAGKLDGVVAMWHDQATIASKLLDWGDAVNVTWGLPFVRTSVDHGVAYDAAADGEAEASGMSAAMEMALRLSPERRQ